jgi:hypothetical protein
MESIADRYSQCSRLGAFNFKVASWGLVNPGIEIRIDTITHKQKRPPRLEGSRRAFLPASQEI